MSATLTKTIAETREQITAARKSGRTIGFVPTMGALHEGHRKLIETARAQSDVVVVSIFVNPLQFGPSEDYSRYPRAFGEDFALCEASGADIVFSPDVQEMYPDKQLTFVDVPKLGEPLCGAFRPGHFRGVATVVLKLFNIVQPDQAYFGEKDLQQLAVIRRMVRDLALPVEIVGVPTVRERDGLAMSSRNRYLTDSQRNAAAVLYRALSRVREIAQSGERDPAVLKTEGLRILNDEPQAKAQYFEVVDAEMQPAVRVAEETYAACAVFFETTRLIDNIRCL